MTNRQRIGWAIIASPFIAIFIFIAALAGILPAIGVFAFAAILVAIITIGVGMTI